MARVFPLSAVLSVRQQKEDAEERALAAVASQITRVREGLHRLEQHMRALSENRCREACSVCMAAHHHADEAQWRALRQAQAELVRELDALEIKRTEQQSRYLAVRRDREVITELRQQQTRAFEADLQRKEQKRVDDLFAARIRRK